MPGEPGLLTGLSLHPMPQPFATTETEDERIPAWRSRLDRPLSGAWCALSWMASTVLFIGIIDWLRGPAYGDAFLSTDSTWAIAHGQLACAFPANGTFTAPLYPLIAGGVAATARIGHGVTFPPRIALGTSCNGALQAFNTWAGKANAEVDTLRIGFVAWLVLLAGVVALLRASG